MLANADFNQCQNLKGFMEGNDNKELDYENMQELSEEFRKEILKTQLQLL